MFVPAALSQEIRDTVRDLLKQGISDCEIGRRVGINRSTVYRWRTNGIPETRAPRPPRRIDPTSWSLIECIDYAYLLGLYLGDGYVGTHQRTHSLVIALDAQYTHLIEECVEAVTTFAPREPSVLQPQGTNGVRVTSYGSAWPQFFPQHGPGKKHERKIELVDWQDEIVATYPRQFLRGLIQSDGSRCENRFTIKLEEGPVEYSYPRYFFTNYSDDIRKLFTDTCEVLGIEWSQPSWRNISVSNRKSVELLDTFVGEKR